MRKSLLSCMSVLLAAAPAWALQVSTTAGGLEAQVPDTTITTLTVTGELDARDFGFISNRLPNLETVDLSGTTIVAYTSPDEPVFGGQTSYVAQQIPTLSFFGKTQLTSVTLPQGLKSVGYAAFAGCTKLAVAELPSSVDSIGGYAFTATALTTVSLPQGITVVGEGAYSRCPQLTAVTVPAGVVGGKAFQADAALTSVTLGNVSAIGDAAFSGCSALTALTLQQPAALRSVGAEAFVESGVTTFDMSGMTNLASIGDFAFAGTGITTVVLPESITALGEGAFYYMRGVTNLVLPESVTQVPAYVLAGTGVSNTDLLPQRASSIGDYALYNISSAIDSLRLPYELSYIGTKAMAGMTGLKRLVALNTVPAELGDSVWAGIDQSKVSLYAASYDYATADQWRDFLMHYSFLRGDVNRDGSVDASDVTALVQHILGYEVAYFDADAADLNGDGVINSTDVTALINLILSGEYVVNASVVTTTDALTLTDLDIVPGSTAQIEVKLANAQSYAALQCDIALPEGLEFVTDGVEGTGRGSQHSWVSGLLPDGTLRLLAVSMSNTPIAAGDGAVAHVTVRASSDLPEQSVMSMANVVLASSDGVPSIASPSQSLVNSVSGVADVTVQQARVYAHDDVLVIESAVACAAQLVAVNGTTRTLLVQAGRNEYGQMTPGVFVVRVAGVSHKVVIK